MKLRRLALVIVAIGCGGSLKEPDAGSGQLGGFGAAVGAGGTAGDDAGPGGLMPSCS